MDAGFGRPQDGGLDFGGQAITAAQMREGGWSAGAATTVPSFRDLFTSANPHLDMNGNGVVNYTDASLMISAIVNRVQADFAPYNINIVSGSMDSEIARLTDSVVGDAFMVVTGGTNTVATNYSTGIYGVAPLDKGNTNDDIGFTFGKNIVDAASTSASVINRMARTISHELGHTFGLDHITDTAGDAVSHHLMNAPNGGVDPRDFTRDFVFMDMEFNSESGRQNAHQILSRGDVLGPSTNAWIAVLTPGQLTITGTEAEDVISVTPNAARTSWTVTGAGHALTLTLASANTTSFNPFDQSLNRIIVRALGSSDRITIDTAITVTTEIHGGHGADTIYGGGGTDYLYGDGGLDHLYGRDGNDYLFGGAGTDYLYGGSGNDWLIGCDAGSLAVVLDYAWDSLYGGEDSDTILSFRDDFHQPEDWIDTDPFDKPIKWFSST